MTRVLVDTSVWVSHFRRRDSALAELLQADRALTHPMVVAELACGTPPDPRATTLGALDLLQKAQLPTFDEIRELIEREHLYGLGCGLVDITLLASTLLTPSTQLWTLDKSLRSLAERFAVLYHPVMH
jgi:predicted nucleic acid-binding protein